MSIAQTRKFPNSLGCEKNQRRSSWDRRRPRLPASNLTKNVARNHSTKSSWSSSARAGGDARGPRTIAFDFFPRFDSARTIQIVRLYLAICLFSLVTINTGSAAAQTSYRVTIEQGVRVKMRDNVTLAADVYRPVGNEKFPVLLERTPYNRMDEAAMANELASHGYIVVLQDTRGRYESGGDFYPFRDESADGYDTVEWAAQLDGSNAKVGMFGGSYVGATQMLAAMAVPPHLVAIFPYVTASEYYEGWTYQSGVLMQWFSSSWTSILATDTLRRQVQANQSPTKWVQDLPLEQYPILKTLQPTALAPYFRDWLTHERDDAFWQRWRVSDHYGEMT